MSAIERLKKVAQERYEVQAKEVADNLGITIKQAKGIIAEDNLIQAEHERLTGVQSPYIF